MAGWLGGFFERFIQSTKRYLKHTTGNAKLSYEELSTVVTEVKLILNTCPLTYIISTENFDEPFTPSHFMTGRILLSFPGVSSGSLSSGSKILC